MHHMDREILIGAHFFEINFAYFYVVVFNAISSSVFFAILVNNSYYEQNCYPEYRSLDILLKSRFIAIGASLLSHMVVALHSWWKNGYIVAESIFAYVSVFSSVIIVAITNLTYAYMISLRIADSCIYRGSKLGSTKCAIAHTFLEGIICFGGLFILYALYMMLCCVKKICVKIYVCFRGEHS